MRSVCIAALCSAASCLLLFYFGMYVYKDGHAAGYERGIKEAELKSGYEAMSRQYQRVIADRDAILERNASQYGLKMAYADQKGE